MQAQRRGSSSRYDEQILQQTGVNYVRMHVFQTHGYSRAHDPTTSSTLAGWANMKLNAPKYKSQQICVHKHTRAHADIDKHKRTQQGIANNYAHDPKLNYPGIHNLTFSAVRWESCILAQRDLYFGTVRLVLWHSWTCILAQLELYFGTMRLVFRHNATCILAQWDLYFGTVRFVFWHSQNCVLAQLDLYFGTFRVVFLAELDL